MQISPEGQHQSRSDDRYQERTSGIQGAAAATAADTMPSASGTHVSDRPQSPRTQYSSGLTRQDSAPGRASNVEYARVPQSPDARIVRDLPPVHPSARSGHRRSGSDSSLVRGHDRFGQQGSEVPRPPGNYSRRVLQDVIQV